MSEFSSLLLTDPPREGSLPIHPVLASQPERLPDTLSAAQLAWIKSSGVKAKAGHIVPLADEQGSLTGVLAYFGAAADVWSVSHLPSLLPPGDYAFSSLPEGMDAQAATLGWLLGGYRFRRYKTKEKDTPLARLVVPEGADADFAVQTAEAIAFARDLITTPASDMTTEALAEALVDSAALFGARSRVIRGEALVEENYPAIYAVGKGSPNAPRLAELRWGEEGAPKVTLVGKGVTFDTGGLDIKPSSAMRLMKKDMGGAAIALSLARLIMQRGLKLQLRVLLPIVENAVSGHAMRPGDVIGTRKGLTVEIGNTDAEGRLILSDALFEADSEKPELLIDFATLTGAARVALGPEIPAFFTPDEALAIDFARHCLKESDPAYRLPLWGGYRELLDSKIADLSNDPESSMGGAITAALFLKEFVSQTQSWLHLDMMAWNAKARPGRPIGGEAQALRALYSLLEERYGRN